MAARALAGEEDNADDGALLARLGTVVVPALGDVLALYTMGQEGAIVLASVAPREAPLSRRLGAQIGQAPEAADGYAEIIASGQPRIGLGAPSVGTATAMDGPAGAPPLSRAAGIASEAMAPLGSGAGPDALLVIGSADRGRQYDAADLATVVVLAALLEGRRTARELSGRVAALRQQLDASAQAGRELAHRLNNDLTMPVGVIELLLDRGTAGAELQEMLDAASKDLAALESHIRVFHDEMRTHAGGSSAPRPPGADQSRPPH